MAIKIEPEDTAVFARLKSTAAIKHRLRRMMTEQFDNCVKCGTQVPHGRPLFAGYDTEGNPLVVGACCANGLTTLATPTYPDMKLNVSAKSSETIWRYMDFAKFVSMLQRKSLYFPALTNLKTALKARRGSRVEKQNGTPSTSTNSAT